MVIKNGLDKKNNKANKILSVDELMLSKKKFKYFLLTSIILLLIIIIIVLIYFSYSSKNNKINNKYKTYIKNDYFYNSNILLPYIWGYEFDQKMKDKQYLKSENLHPLDLGRVTIFLLQEGYKKNNIQELNLGKEYLEFLINSYPMIIRKDDFIIWQYPFSWDNYPKGWYSAMANSAIGLAFLIGYDIFGDFRYKMTAIKAINAVVSSTEDGGCAIKFNKNSFVFEEYVYNEINKNNAEFVLNGFLFSLLTVRIFAETLNDSYYLKMYNYGLNGLKKIYKNYYYKNKNWTYYCLNPKVIETPHYAIYDMILFDELYKITGDDFYFKELTMRKEILRLNYPLELYIDKESSINFVFSLIGPPHPYWIDIYPIKIDFFDQSENIICSYEVNNPRDFNTIINKRAFINGVIDKSSFKYKISSIYANNSFTWQEGFIKDILLIKNIESFKKIFFKINCYYDAEYDKINNKILIDPSKIDRTEDVNYYTNNQGIIKLKFSSKFDWKLYKYIGLIIKPTKNIYSIKFDIYDYFNNVASRYYVKLKQNEKNFILLNWEGFNNIDNLNQYISHMNIIIYTSEYSLLDKFEIELDDIILFQNNIQLFKFFEVNNLFFPEEPGKGNIY